MKVLALISCLCAVASAGYLGPHAGYLGYAAGYGGHYAGPQHIPVIGPHGVPLEPPANVAARAAHAAAHAAAAHGSAGLYYGGAVGPYAVGHLGHLGHVGPVIGPNGVPLELPENVAARAAHAAAHVEAKARNGDLGHLGHLGHLGLVGAYGVHGHAATVIGPHGVPLEPPANVAARALHAAAHAEAAAHSGAGYLHYRRRRGIFAGAQHIPVIGPHGVPLEPPANVAARAAHAAAHAAAAHGVVAHGGAIAVGPVGYYGHGHAYPALAHDGQPLETPEVVAAKSAHFAAHAEANARNHAGLHYGADPYALAYGSPYAVAHVPAIGHNGVPLDTPEVAAARAAHLQAHHAAQSHGGYY